MYLSKINLSEADDDLLQRIVFPDKQPADFEHCQVALVLGTSNPNADRTPEAVKQYKNGVCDKLLLSGGVFWGTEYGRITEAEYMQRFAIEHGVPVLDTLLDNMSRTTIENMLCGAIALNRAFGYISEVKDLLLVTSLYHIKRSTLLANALMPRKMRIHPCPAYGLINESNWKTSNDSRKRLYSEATFMQEMIKNGLTDDINI